MPLFRRCFCWRDVRSGSVASGVFTLTFALIQLLLQTAVWVTAASKPRDGAPNLFVAPSEKLTKEILEDLPYYVTYIPLGCLDLLLIILSVIMMVGIDRDYKGRTWLLPWIVFLPLYVLYETAINVYLLVYAFDGSKLNWPFALPIIIGVYWFIKLVINISGFLCVISRYQELSKYGRTLAKRSSLANSFEREYPGANYFTSMTGRGQYEEERSRQQKYRPEPREPRRYHDGYEQSNGRGGHSHPPSSQRDYPPRQDYDYRAANGYHRY